MRAVEKTAEAELPPVELRAGPDRTGAELKRGMFFNTIALLASNFRGIFTFLIARLLGAAVLGTFLVAWATTDILCKIGMFGLDNAIIPFIARAEVAGERARSRALFHLAVFLALAQSAIVAAIAIVVVRLAGNSFGLDPHMVAVLSVLLCAMPGVNLYRICTAVSRAMKVMKHDILVARADGIDRHNDRISRNGRARLEGLRRADCRNYWHRRVRDSWRLSWPHRSFVPRPRRAAQFPIAAEARRLLAYSASISGYDLINALDR